MCAREGAQVVFFDTDVAGAEATSTRSRRRGCTAGFLQVDITQEDQVRRRRRARPRALRTIDALVNNAGVNAYFDAAEMTEAQWDAVFAVDLKGAWLCAKHVLPVMKANGHGPS